ncbi:MAG: Crp/Fnr family transcriptional regulator [Clostridiaceae bacterium]|nr:Crp/Fnr family transcriptional regulator [Clostridiaceae bacterium]
MVIIKNKWEEILVNSLLFSDIDRKDIIHMLNCLSPKEESFGKGEFIARAGQPMKGLGLLLDGSVSVLKENVDGNRIIINILKPGELFGEMAVFSDERVWPASISALTGSTVLFISPDKIVGRCANACSFHRQLTVNMLKLLSDKAMKLNKKVEYMSIRGMREKLCTFFWEQYKKQQSNIIHLPMKRNEMADFLNVSRPSMSREMSRMREEGLIDFYLSTVKILKPDKITEYVQ